jgi:mRNA-degrading endonuclease toxin of MazEF toxin-antitoxin module
LIFLAENKGGEQALTPRDGIDYGDHTVTVSQDRLGKRVAQLSGLRMNEICAALRFSLGCDVSQS